ncbi:MAG TPA: TIGR04282 family arsenosugar biosynthesis glycosyltransferase [Pirellulaceae bacterium]|nr:TIGR04282 family arsenosugar biosynthesis glycosyltransferase [Pirellulaceae bacterium]
MARKDSPTPGTLLGVFARYWQPGQVKTRLARRIGNESAARLHRKFVETTLLRLAGLGGEQWLAVSPGEALPQMAQECHAAADWRLSEQNGSDLGSRMSDFFSRAFEQADRVALVGSDSPDLPREYVEEALAELARVPVVLGPSGDGGYYLIGQSARPGKTIDLEVLFDGIPWSTPHVLPLTLDRLAKRGIDYHLLPAWCDVDEWDDLAALQQRLSQQGAKLDEPLAALLATVAAEFARIQAGANR